MRLRFEKPDGSSREYFASTKGESKHYFFDHSTYFNIMASKVTEANLQSLSAQILADQQWLQR